MQMLDSRGGQGGYDAPQGSSGQNSAPKSSDQAPQQAPQQTSQQAPQQQAGPFDDDIPF